MHHGGWGVDIDPVWGGDPGTPVLYRRPPCAKCGTELKRLDVPGGVEEEGCPKCDASPEARRRLAVRKVLEVAMTHGRTLPSGAATAEWWRRQLERYADRLDAIAEEARRERHDADG